MDSGAAAGIILGGLALTFSVPIIVMKLPWKVSQLAAWKKSIFKLKVEFKKEAIEYNKVIDQMNAIPKYEGEMHGKPVVIPAKIDI